MANGGTGMGAHEVGMMGSGQPPATEYTLQGVMRFLQTEWHRHERDRNAWEIERQEMKSRIAHLEGQARRSDATQKALKKYVTILEKKVKEQIAQSKAGTDGGSGPGTSTDTEQKSDRAAALQEKLAPTASPKPAGPVEPTPIEAGLADEEAVRNELKSFLDQCQAEFTYLMITPANPIPPRDSPPLPVLEDLRDGGDYGGQMLDPVAYQQHNLRQQQQNHAREILAAQARSVQLQNAHAQQVPGAGNFQIKPYDVQSAPMGRTTNPDQQPPAPSYNPNEWQGQVAASGKQASEFTGEPVPQPKHLSRLEERGDTLEKNLLGESDTWDFGDSPDAGPANPSQQLVSSTRPDTDVFPTAENIPKSPNRGALSHRRKSSSSSGRRRSVENELSLGGSMGQKTENQAFKLKFGLRGHLDAIRAVIFSGGGSPGEPEICTAADDGLIKRFHIPDRQTGTGSHDLDVVADFTHRGHNGAVLSLASWSPSPNFSTGGRAQGDGWIFSGGKDATIRVWERGRIDPKATIDAHSDAVWALCVLPSNLGNIFGQSTPHGTPDRILLVSGAADGLVKIWAVSAPPQLTSPQPSAGRRGPGGRVRGNSMSSGSAFPNSPQPSTASNSPFNHTLIHSISRPNSKASPTCITPLSPNGETFVVSYSDAAIIVYDTRSGEEIGTMLSLETYDGTPATSVNSVVATVVGLDQHQGATDEENSSGPTGGGRAMAGSGVEGVVISGHEDCYIRFFDANSGQCTYNMVAHPAAISSLSLSPDGRELVSGGHDSSLRFWSLEKRSCTQELTSHRTLRGEGVCSVVWSQDGRWVVSAGGDGVVKVFAR